MEVIVGNFELVWKRKDGKIHKANYDDLIKVYEKQEEHDKEIRNNTISNFADWCYINGIDFSYMSTPKKSGQQFIDDVIERYYKEEMKEMDE